MDNQFEKSISFKKHTGKETALKIISETHINEGVFGDIFDAVVEINGKRKRFIVKKYKSFYYRTIFHSAEENAKEAMENYTLAKNSGLKVFPTFRMGEDGKSILMTTGFLNDQICVSVNNTKNIVDFEKTSIKEIQDLNKFLTEFFTEGLKAAQKGIRIHEDVVFFILNKTEPTKIDFVLGDVDSLLKKESTKLTGLKNIEDLKSILVKFCARNIDLSFFKEFLERVEYYCNQAKNSVENDKTLK